MFQCPISGQLHFYQSVHRHYQQQLQCFNALYRANSISTSKGEKNHGKNNHVSMPYIGPTPFLQTEEETEEETEEVFQCPISGQLHFYIGETEESIDEIIVSMPYIGPTPFLHIMVFYNKNFTKVFQCPISGQLHFYSEADVKIKIRECVSMPYIGPTPFLPLGTGKLHKHWFLKASFACNSQNILTNHSFNFQIWLLTLCSYLCLILYQKNTCFSISKSP